MGSGEWVVVVHLAGAPSTYDVIVGPFRMEQRARRYGEVVERVASAGSLQGVSALPRKLTDSALSASAILAKLTGA